MEHTTGIIQDLNGNPVPNALVSVEWSSVPFPEMAFRTDFKGRFQIGLPVGERFRLAARTPEGGYGFINIEVNSGNIEAIIQISQ